MTPVKNELTTLILGKPQDWDEAKLGPCLGLPVARTDEPSFYSYWRATWKERLAILFGRPVRLCVVGRTHPPVHLDTIER